MIGIPFDLNHHTMRNCVVKCIWIYNLDIYISISYQLWFNFHFTGGKLFLFKTKRCYCLTEIQRNVTIKSYSQRYDNIHDETKLLMRKYVWETRLWSILFCLESMLLHCRCLFCYDILYCNLQEDSQHILCIPFKITQHM